MTPFKERKKYMLWGFKYNYCHLVKSWEEQHRQTNSLIDSNSLGAVGVQMVENYKKKGKAQKGGEGN